MRRLVILVAVLGALVAGCARSPSGGDGGDGGVVLPTGGAAVSVAAWRLEGGFVPAGMRAISAPRLVVYSDGRAVADAERMLTLTVRETGELVGALRHDLAGLPATATPRPGGPQVADAATSVLEVRGADGRLQSVQAYALEIVQGYPRSIYAARDRLAPLAERVARDGVPYTSDRIRLVAERREEAGAGSTVAPWPAGVPVPSTVDGQSGVRVLDLAGVQSEAAALALPRDLVQPGTWPLRRTPDGGLLAVSWRYLLPGE